MLIDFDGKSINDKIRHVSCPFSFGSSFTEALNLLVKVKKLCTVLLTFGDYKSSVLDESMLNTLILSFRSLRVLDIHGLEITRVPDSIGKLIHLRYLDLSRNESIYILPDSISRLWNLQTLKLRGCTNIQELPRKIGELVNLRHLDNSDCDSLSHMPRGLGQITSLQTLSLFVVSKASKHIGGLGELNKLNNLRGTLNITHLERMEDANSESKAANLREKQHLEGLSLHWSHGDNYDEKSLEGLQPHQNLKCLFVQGYGGVRFSSWLCSLINLVDLTIENCKRCQDLPLLSQIPFLEHLVLSMMDDLEYISAGDISEEVPTSSIVSRTFFPSLKSLTIKYCRKLKGWWRRRDFVVSTPDHDHSHHQYHPSLPSFPCLSFLLISECPNLTFMPLFPYLEEQLYLDNVSWKPLQQTMTMASSLPSSSSSPLSRLKSMFLRSVKDMDSLPNEWASNLNFLKNLVIINCLRLSSLSRAMQYLTSLEELWITDCDEFKSLSDIDDDDDGMEWEHLNCLRSLRFESLLKLESLPAGLQHVATLQKLIISACPNLISLPEWICELTSLEHLVIARCASKLTSIPAGISCLTSLRVLTIADFPNLMTLPESICNLTSLEELEIVRCPSLIALPDGMHYLKSLQKLRIVNCPYLKKRCKKEIGEDWPKITHVPYLSIYPR